MDDAFANTAFRLLMLACTGLPLMALAGEQDPLDAYGVVWKTPSKNSSGSMPLGNGDVGLNVWVEAGGNLHFYISKTDAWSENGRLLKVGRVRVTLSPNPFAEGLPFEQTLRLRQGEIEIRAGKGPSQTTLRVWVDANHPVIRVETENRHGHQLQVSIELWRTKPRQLKGQELHSAYGMAGAPHPVLVQPDTVLPARGDRIAWCHHNKSSIWPETLKVQGLDGFKKDSADPLLHRTFGGLIRGEGLVAESPTSLRSADKRPRHVVAIHIVTAQAPTVKDWVQEVEELAAKTDAAELGAARSAHRRWWDAFWNRSWIRVSGAAAGAKVSQVAQGYALQRFVAACAGRGNSPIKFNGTIFTVEARRGKEQFDADYRRWGGPYWFQNTRLAYWPMLAAGDYEMMLPLFRMYLAALPLAQARTRIYFGHEGACFPETMYFWGAYANDNFGWNRKGKPVSHCDNTYIRHYWSGALELATLMLDRYDHTQDDGFLKTTLLPFAEPVLAFYDKHYPRDPNGKLLLKPAQALETWQRCVNPLPPIAGLRFVLDRLLALPARCLGADQRKTWQRLRREVPGLPMKKGDGTALLLPAGQIFQGARNSENPELYAIFPYRLYGVGKPDLDVARATFAARRVKRTGGWTQDPIQAACLGLADVASRYTAQNFAHKDPGSRFPAFWGPNFDWIPDQDHGSVALMALQAMLLQAEGKAIRLFPAWPKRWDVEFRLHAPFKTTVEGVLRSGKLQRLEVTPENRTADLIVMEPQ